MKFAASGEDIRPKQQPPRVAVIVLNWNGADNTLACLESLFQTRYPRYYAVVCDNHSTDDSFSKIQSFLAHKFRPLSVESWASFSLHAKKRVECCNLYGAPSPTTSSSAGVFRAALLRTRWNMGFAGGNNTAISFARRLLAPHYFWLLNNDTVVTQHALSALMQRMAEEARPGMCGSTLLAMDGNIQSLGGYRYLQWTGTGVPLRAGGRRPDRTSPNEVEERMDYVSGASMLVSRDFIEAVGLMDEGYFLYFEEIDWARRARGRFKFLYAPDSIVYHREGGTIGSSADGNRRSEKSFYWLCRSRVRFTARHHPEALPTVLGYSVMNALSWTLKTRKRSIFTHCLRGIADALIKRRVPVAG